MEIDNYINMESSHSREASHPITLTSAPEMEGEYDTMEVNRPSGLDDGEKD